MGDALSVDSSSVGDGVGDDVSPSLGHVVSPSSLGDPLSKDPSSVGDRVGDDMSPSLGHAVSSSSVGDAVSSSARGNSSSQLGLIQ